MTVQVLNADVFAALSEIASDSVDCVVTSPPYWGLRDYGTGTWQGGDLECDHRSSTMDLARDEGHPVLAGSPATNSAQLLRYYRSSCGVCGAQRADLQIGPEPSFAAHIAVLVDVFREIRRVLKPEGTLWLNYGDAYATTRNGWTHLTHDGRYKSKRDDRTHTDKPFSTIGGGLKRKDLSLVSARLAIALCDDGWWLRADNIWVKPNAKPESIKDRPTQAYEHVFLLTKSASYFFDAGAVREPSQKRKYSSWKTRSRIEPAWQGDPASSGYRNGVATLAAEGGRHIRNVWTIPTEPYPDAHFATMPVALAELAIRAGCPAGGLVLDPFGGSGSTAIAAQRLDRDAVLIDLSADYCAMAKRRLAADRLVRRVGDMTDVNACTSPTPIELYIAAAS